MAEREIVTMLDKLYPLTAIPTDIQALIPSTESVASDESRPSSQTSRRRSVWSRISRSGRSSTSRTSSTGREGRPEIPRLLQDPWAEDGIARLEAYYYQRQLGHEGERIRKVAVELPEQWLLEALIQREAKSRKHPGKFDSVWREFSRVPDDYRYLITNDISQQQRHADDDEGKWVLIYLECVRAENKSRLLSRQRRDDVIGVYVVLKHVRKRPLPMYRHDLNNRRSDVIIVERDEPMATTGLETGQPQGHTASARRQSSRSRSIVMPERSERRRARTESGARQRSGSTAYRRSRTPSPDYHRYDINPYGGPVTDPYYARPPPPSQPFSRPQSMSQPAYYPGYDSPPAAYPSPYPAGYPVVLEPQGRPGPRSHSRQRAMGEEMEDFVPIPIPIPIPRRHRDRGEEPLDLDGLLGDFGGMGLKSGPGYRPPRRQDSNDSYTGRRREVHFDHPPVRQNTDDSLEPAHSHLRGSFQRRQSHYVPLYGDEDDYRPQTLDDIEEVLDEHSTSSSGLYTSSDADEYKDPRDLDDAALQDRLLKEYTRPVDLEQVNAKLQEAPRSTGKEEEKVEDGAGETSATGGLPVERTMTDSPAPIKPDAS
jgi:hypothetical protein